MRNLTSSARSKINQRTATEPIIVIKVTWKTGIIRRYADKDHQNAKGRILSMGGFEVSQKLKGGQSTSVNIVLDDSDNDLRNILKTSDPHEAEAIVYQSFNGLSSSNNFVLFKGRINSPVVWSEGERTVRFTIQSELESREVGFSPESGFFDFVDPSIIGQPWPICFGEVIRVPTQRITPRISATSLTRFKPITNDLLKVLEERIKKYTLILAEIGITDNILDIEDIEIIILNDDYIALLEEIAKAYREFTTILEELIVTNPTQEDNLNLFVINVINRTLKERQLTKIAEFIATTVEKQQILQGEINDLDEARQTEQDKSPFQNQQIIDSIVQNVLPPLVFQIGGLNTLIGQLAGLQITINAELFILNAERDTLITAMTVFDLTIIDFYNNEEWPQGVLTILANKQRLTGSVTDSQFTLAGVAEALDLETVNISARLGSNPNEFWIQNWTSGKTPHLRNRYLLVAGLDDNGLLQRRVIFVTQQEGNHCYFSPIVYEERNIIDGRQTYGFKLFAPGDVIEQQSSAFLAEAWVPLLSPQPFNAPDFVTGMYQLMVSDWSLDIGDPITHTSDFDEVYIANLYESVSVDEVMAYRDMNGKRLLMPLPLHYYTIDLAFAIAGFTTTVIKLQRPLREYEGENWEDKIFVSLESTLSSNTSDVIKWLIETWTDFTVDSSSFNSVKSSLTNFPSNFALLKKEDALSLIEDIAWQARCAVWLVNDVIFIKYLSKEPTTDLTITDKDIEVGSYQETFTGTDELITIVEGEWKPDLSAPEPNKIILRNNVPIYGVHKEEYNIFIYNIEELVQRTLTFWLIRKSNTWRKVIFTGFMNLLEVEVFDTVRLNVSNSVLPPVKTVVEEIEYDNENQSIVMTLWTPIRARFLIPYPFAWMSSAPSNLEYPTVDDPHAGGG